MKSKVIYALLALSLLTGCIVPQSQAFAEGDETVQDEETGEPEQPTEEPEQPNDDPTEDTPGTDDSDEGAFSDPGSASDGLGSGNNGGSVSIPSQPQTPPITTIPGEVVTSDSNNGSDAAVSPSETSNKQIHVSGTAYSADNETEISAMDEYVETNLDGDIDNAEDVEIPNTGEEDGINMLAVGLLAIAGITIMAAAAVVILMNRLAKRAENELL